MWSVCRWKAETSICHLARSPSPQQTHVFITHENGSLDGIRTQDERQVGRGRDFAHWVRRRASLSYCLGCSVRSGKPPPTDACLRLDMKHGRKWAGLARLHSSLLSGFPSASWAHHRLSSRGATLFMNNSGRVVSLCSEFFLFANILGHLDQI